MIGKSDIDPDIQLLKQYINNAAIELEQRESNLSSDLESGLGSLIYLGSHQDAIPRNLLLDSLLESGEIHTWALLKIQLKNPSLPSSIPRQDELMKVLKCSRPVLSRHLQVLRAMRWITLCAEVRGLDGKFKGNVYVQHDKPLSLQETLFLDPDYIQFLEQPSRGPVLKRLRKVKQSILMYMDSQLVNGTDLHRLPTDLEQSLGRLKTSLNSHVPDWQTSLSTPCGLHGYEDEEEPTIESNLVSADAQIKDPKYHVNNFYMDNSDEKTDTSHVKDFYMDIRSSSSSSSYINTTTTTHLRLKFPKAIKSERERMYASKVLSALNEDSQKQFALDYLADRIGAGEQGTDVQVGNPIRYLNWIVKQITNGTLPESSYGIRQVPKSLSTPQNAMDDAEDRKREHAAWVRSMREKGYPVDPETGVPLKVVAGSSGTRVG
jgi:hypothetical protein